MSGFYYSREMVDILSQTMNNSQRENLLATLEVDGSNIDIHKTFLYKIIDSIKKITNSRPSRSKLFDESILKSHGDITKVKNINNSLDALNLLTKVKDPLIKNRVRTLKTYYDNLKKRKTEWKKLEHISNESARSFYERGVADVLYNGLYVLGVKSFVNGVSVLIVNYVDSSNMYGNDNSRLVFGGNTLGGYIFENINKEIELYKNGKIDKTINYVIKRENKVKEDAMVIVVGLGIIMALITVLLSIRIFVYYYYYTRMQLADYFDHQADFLDLHKSELKKNKNLTAVEQNKIITKQHEWAERFRKISNWIADDEIKAVKLAKQDVVKNEQNIATQTTNEINVDNTGMDFF